MDFSKLANFGRKVFNVIRDNVKVNVDSVYKTYGFQDHIRSTHSPFSR